MSAFEGLRQTLGLSSIISMQNHSVVALRTPTSLSVTKNAQRDMEIILRKVKNFSFVCLRGPRADIEIAFRNGKQSTTVCFPVPDIALLLYVLLQHCFYLYLQLVVGEGQLFQVIQLFVKQQAVYL